MNKIYKAMRERTKEEFWISCGLVEIECRTDLMVGGNDSGTAWFVKDERKEGEHLFIGYSMPSTDSVDDLLKYGWPVAEKKLMEDTGLSPNQAKQALVIQWMEQWGTTKDPAQALYHVLQKVLGGER